MASNGDNKVTVTTVENGGRGLSTGENPKKILDLNSVDPDRTDEILDAEVEGLSESVGEKKAIGTTVGVDSGDASPVDDDIQKKIKRAERFGVSVNLTEKEKRNSRAERFGSVAAANDSDGTKKAEELKRKARADRFGVPAPTSTADKTSTTDKTEEEAKKKARLARFGKDGKDTKVDSAEEDKRKARALRFSKPASDTSSDLSGKQNVGEEAAISANAT